MLPELLGDDRLPPKLRNFVRELFHAPFESFSRFLLPQPRVLMPEEAYQHLKAGWGLKCLEKTLLLQKFLTDAGINSSIISSGFEFWIRGENALRFKGRASQPLEEVEGRLIKLYASERETSPYEVPAHLSHLAVTIDDLQGERYLVDVTGQIVCPKVYRGDEVELLLDARPKPYVLHMPYGMHLYYHRISNSLLDLVLEKEKLRAYSLGRHVLGPLFARGHFLGQIRWYWDEEKFSRENSIAQQPSDGQSVSFYEDPEEMKNKFPQIFPAKLWDGLITAWPLMVETVRAYFEEPKVIKIQLAEFERPLIAYTTGELYWNSAGRSETPGAFVGA